MVNFFDENPYDITKIIVENPESVIAHINLSKIKTISDFLNLKAGSKILDCGCGTGFPTLFYSSENQHRYFSIDISNAELSLAKKYSQRFTKEIEWLMGDGCHLPFKDNSFDAAFCIALLHHIDKYQDLVDELVRVAKKIVVCEPNKFCPMQWIYQRQNVAKLAGDTKAFSINELKTTFQKSGLHNIHSKRINLIPQTITQAQLNHWKIVEDYLLRCFLTNIFAGTIVIYGEK